MLGDKNGSEVYPYAQVVSRSTETLADTLSYVYLPGWSKFFETIVAYLTPLWLRNRKSQVAHCISTRSSDIRWFERFVATLNYLSQLPWVVLIHFPIRLQLVGKLVFGNRLQMCIPVSHNLDRKRPRRYLTKIWSPVDVQSHYLIRQRVAAK